MQINSIQALMRADAFPHPVGELTLIETHISWVILTGDYAYKIKKPLNLGFLDFSSCAKRKFFCSEEIRLNQRFAPEVYIDSVPIYGTDATPSFIAAGAPIDYAVKMRQFEQSQLLDAIYQRGELDAELIRRIARQLATTYAELPSLRPSEGAGTPATLRAAIDENFEQIGEYGLTADAREQLQQLTQATCDLFDCLLPKMQQRLQDGFVKDLHGDLHLGNIALVDGQIRCFDCIEFNPGFRIMDTVAEIAFITMDMEARGAASEGRRLLNNYLEYSGDYQSLTLLNLYRCYYATVRAKVTLMQFRPGDDALLTSPAYTSFCKYLALALHYTQTLSPSLALMHGVAGSGKTTVAAQLCERSGAISLRSDVERKRLFGLAPEQDSSGLGQNIYSAEANAQTQSLLVEQARKVLSAGFSCILDATFLRGADRQQALALAGELDLRAVIIDCQAPLQSIRERLTLRQQSRSDASEAGIAVMEQQLAVEEPLNPAERKLVQIVDTTQALPESLVRQLDAVGRH